MYSNDGAYGRVRMAHHTPVSEHSSLFLPGVCGWHCCNDLYHIDRRGSGFDRYLILITVSGMGSMTINNTEYSLPTGTVALLPRNTKVSYQTPRNGLWEFYWIHPSVYCNGFLDEVARCGNFVSSFSPSHNYRDRVERLIRLLNEKKPDSELEISLEMSTILHYCAIDLSKSTATASLAQRACAHITRGFKESPSLDSIAAELFVSTAHLIRAFKKEYGCTPHQYLIGYRLSYSIDLLKFSNMQIDEIADAVGFSSASHYISAFKRKYGETPTRYKA